MRPILLALILLAPTVLAAPSERLSDPADKSDSAGDVVAAWVETETGGVRFYVQVAGAPNVARTYDHIYGIQFLFGATRVDALVGYGVRDQLGGYLGPDSGPNWARGGFETVQNGQVVDLRAEFGTPATFSGLIPWGAMSGFEEGSTLRDIAAFASIYDRGASRWRGSYDGVGRIETYTAESDSVGASVGRVVDAAAPWLLLVATGLGAAGGYALYRRSQRT